MSVFQGCHSFVTLEFKDFQDKQALSSPIICLHGSYEQCESRLAGNWQV